MRRAGKFRAGETVSEWKRRKSDGLFAVNEWVSEIKETAHGKNHGMIFADMPIGL